MTDITKVAIAALQAKARELIVDRDDARRKLLEEAYNDLIIERDLSGCISGARALGAEIDVSGGVVIPPAKTMALTQFVQFRSQMAGLYAQLRAEFGIEDDNPDDAVDDSRPDMPRVADIILERLQVAGDEGAKAADIKRFILRTYKSDIHVKTVGMTLNRMRVAGQVRRDGHSWFLIKKEAAG
jgi:hypothetical protein